MILSVHVPGGSPIHRMAAGSKLAGLAGVVLVAFLVTSPVVLGALFLLSIAAAAIARLPPAALWRQLKGAVLLLSGLALFQLWLEGPAAATELCLRFASAILLATVVSATTRLSDTIAVIECCLSPFSGIGIHPARVAFAVAMTIRFVPLLMEEADRIREAQAARGRASSLVALAVPLVGAGIRIAEGMAEAIAARGADP